MKRTIMSLYMLAATIVVSLLAVNALGLPPSAQAQQQQQQTAAAAAHEPITNPACGEVVQGNVNLTANLNCNGDGLVVGADNTVINLNGYTITGPGQQSSKVGVVVPNN